MSNLPLHHQPFNIRFPDGHSATAVRIRPEDNPLTVLQSFDLGLPRSVIFVSGGAGGMSEEDRQRVYEMMGAIAHFAEENNTIIIDGGTESGVMQMIGEVRHTHRLQFPLIGVSPLGKVSYPGYENPQSDAQLEDGHTHFLLVDGDDWGAESAMIMHLAYTICDDGRLPSVGVLINGGRIALHEVYLASTSEHRMGIIVLEGSGRAADEISTALRSGGTSRKILQAILRGGDIRLVGTVEGPQVLQQRLREKFEQQAGR